jgi:hypothetical protein
MASYDFAEDNARRLRSLRTGLATPPAFFGIMALFGWLGVLSGDRSLSNFAAGLTTIAVPALLGYGLLYAIPPDWATSFDVGSRELEVRYRRKTELVIPWTDPASSLIVVDTPTKMGRRAVNQRPIVIAKGNQFITSVPEAAMEALKLEMAAQGYRFELVEGSRIWRLKWALPFGSTALRPVRIRDSAIP